MDNIIIDMDTTKSSTLDTRLNKIVGYINNNPGDKLNFFTEKYLDPFKEEKLFGKRISFKQQTELNHAIFAQAMVDDVKGNFHGKTAQLLLRSLSTPINNGTINPYQLSKIFKSQQGLVEVPIHLVLYIGGLYDFYYHSENYKPDEKINLSKINGITGANGKDILENDILGGANPARFIFDSNGDGLLSGNGVTLVDSQGTELFYSAGDYGSGTRETFGYQVALGVNDNATIGAIVYPNPAKNTLNISGAESASIDIYDVTGRVVMQRGQLDNNAALDISSLNTGVYFVRLVNNGQTQTEKLIVSK